MKYGYIVNMYDEKYSKIHSMFNYYILHLIIIAQSKPIDQEKPLEHIFIKLMSDETHF